MEFDPTLKALRRAGLGALVAVAAIAGPVALAGCSGHADRSSSVEYKDTQNHVDCPVEALSDNPDGC